jgi:hypothetical protein
MDYAGRGRQRPRITNSELWWLEYCLFTLRNFLNEPQAASFPAVFCSQ